MLGAIAAYIIGYKPWVPDYDRLMTMVEWQGGPTVNGVDNSWIPLYKPVTANYEEQNVGGELFLFTAALAIVFWGWRNRNHKVDATAARIFFGLALVAVVYFPLLWLARQHVEGDWTAVPPRLISYEVDTHEFLAKQAAFKAELEAIEFKRTGMTAAQRQRQWEKMSSKGIAMLLLYALAFAFVIPHPFVV